MKDTPHPSILTVGSLTMLAAAILACLEIGFAACLTLAGVAVYAGACTLIVLPFLIYRPSVGKLIIYLFFLTFCLVVLLVPWNSRKAFLANFNRIRPGMTVPQVEDVMKGYVHGTCWPPSPNAGPRVPHSVGSPSSYAAVPSTDEPQPAGCLIFRHSEEPRFNSDRGVVRFEDGHVVSTEFLSDS
jgi:hypothetical protein